MPESAWKHSGPCLYCQHGPHCMRDECERGPLDGPVCTECSLEIKRAEIAADPYFSGDYYAMFGDDE
jgi:hypothetical protein